MESFLISIRPKWTASILNGKKTVEIRRTAPKDWVDYFSGKTDKKPEPKTVYIYCTKNDNGLRYWGYHIGGRIFAKFTLREVTQYITGNNVSKDSGYMFGDAEREGVYEKACLSESDIDRYCPDESFYAWHISDLVIFDRPRELSEFMPPKWDKCGVKDKNGLFQCDKCPYGDWANVQCKWKPLTKAPQSWCRVEVKDVR